jgi:hypothetical protein
MQSFIDDKYLLHLFNSILKSDRFSSEADLYKEILSFFKGKTSISLESDFGTMINNLDKKNVQVVLTLLNKLTTGRNGTTIKTKQTNKFRDLKRVEVYSKFKSPFASFWLGNTYNHPIEKYSKFNPFYFLSPEDELIKWQKMSKHESFYISSTSNKDFDDVLTDWSKLKTFSHPSRDIIINDRYCLKDKVGIKLNIIPIIENLVTKESQIENIILFTYPNELINNSIKESYEFFKEQLDEKEVNYRNLIVFKSYATPHSRRILTNNFFIKSDDSLDYFNAGGRHKTKGSLLSISPIFEANKSEIKDLVNIWANISINSSDEMKFGSVSTSILDLMSEITV